MKKRDMSGSKNPMYGKKRLDAVNFFNNHREKIRKINSCPVSCEGVIFNSVGEAQNAYPGISIRRRLNDDKYPDFFRLRPKTKRK